MAGAAWATIIGNFDAVIYYLIYFLREKGIISIFPKDFKPSLVIYKEVVKIGLPSSLAQIIMSFANIFTNNLAVVYGDEVISAFGVAGKALMMVTMMVTGLMYAQSVADLLTTTVALVIGIPFLQKLHKHDKKYSLS